MVGYIIGRVLLSDGKQALILTNQGIGYELHFSGILVEGQQVSLFISQVVRDNSIELFGHKTLQQKKLFEILLTVKGVGPKSAYTLINFFSENSIIQAINHEDVKTLQKAPGVGARAASQIILDLKTKISKINLSTKFSHEAVDYANEAPKREPYQQVDFNFSDQERQQSKIKDNKTKIAKRPGYSYDDVMTACRELGFSDQVVVPRIQQILRETPEISSEQLIRLVLQRI